MDGEMVKKSSLLQAIAWDMEIMDALKMGQWPIHL